MSPFYITWEDFGVMTKKFLNRIKDKSISLESLEQAKKAWALHYLNLDQDSDPIAKINAPHLFQITMKQYMDRMDSGV